LIEYVDEIKINNINIHINNFCNCQTSNVIYYLKCKGDSCNEDYIGSTNNQLNIRMIGHRRHIRTPEYSKINASDHFRLCNKGFSVTPIYIMPINYIHMTEQMECYFRNILKPTLNRTNDYTRRINN